MAFDSRLYLRSYAASNSLASLANAAGTVVITPKILLPGVPLRGLNINVVVPAIASTPSLVVELWEGVSTGATFRLLKALPAITAAGDYNYRFHLSPGYYAVGATLSLAGGTGTGTGNTDVRIGMDLGAHGGVAVGTIPT